MLITYVQSSQKYLQAIESLSDRSRFLARKAGRPRPTLENVAAARKEGVARSGNALASVMSGARHVPSCRPACKVVKAALQGPFKSSAELLQMAADSTFSAPARDAGESVLSP